MRFLSIYLVLFTMFLSGCNMQTGVAPLESVVPKSADRDFGFIGTWIPNPNPELGADVSTYEMTIERADFYTATLTDSSGQNEHKLVFEFRTHEMSKDHPHAIVELEYKSIETNIHRRILYASVQDERLCVWTVDGRKIGEHLFNNGVAAVIEHSTFSSTVRCDPKKLLDLLQNHSREIIGTPKIFKRKPKLGG